MRLDSGYRSVNSSVTGVMTRFGLRSALDAVATKRDFDHVMDDIRSSGTPGLVASAFLVEPFHTCYSWSIWASDEAIPWFGTYVPSHVTAARRVFGRLASSEDGPELWSTRWRLEAVSRNLNWPGVDKTAFGSAPR